MKFISAEEWAVFEKRYPGAADYLRAANLRGERAALTAELQAGPADPRRKAWAEKRLEDLRWYFEDWKGG